MAIGEGGGGGGIHKNNQEVISDLNAEIHFDTYIETHHGRTHKQEWKWRLRRLVSYDADFVELQTDTDAQTTAHTHTHTHTHAHTHARTHTHARGTKAGKEEKERKEKSSRVRGISCSDDVDVNIYGIKGTASQQAMLQSSPTRLLSGKTGKQRLTNAHRHRKTNTVTSRILTSGEPHRITSGRDDDDDYTKIKYNLSWGVLF